MPARRGKVLKTCRVSSHEVAPWEKRLIKALAQTREDLANGRFIVCSAEEHVKRLKIG